MNGYRLLLVEDDADLGQLLARCLRDCGYETERAMDCRQAKQALRRAVFDLAIIDVALPDGDGFSLAASLRREHPRLPFFFLTARDRSEDRLRGLDLGANDYITKPFELDELLLRIGNFLDRCGQTAEPGLELGVLGFDPDRYLLSLTDGQSAELTARESHLLELLVRNRHRVVPRDELMTRVWGRADYFVGRSLDVFISRLRKHLAADPELTIRTVRGVGFILECRTE